MVLYGEEIDIMGVFVREIKENTSHLGWFKLGLSFYRNDQEFSDMISALRSHTGDIETVQLEYSRFYDGALEKILDCLVGKRVKNLFLTHCHYIDADVLTNFIVRNGQVIDQLDLDTTGHDVSKISSLVRAGRIKHYSPGLSMGLVWYGDYSSSIKKLNDIYNAQMICGTCYVDTSRILPDERRYNGNLGPKTDEEKNAKTEYLSIIEKMRCLNDRIGSSSFTVSRCKKFRLVS